MTSRIRPDKYGLYNRPWNMIKVDREHISSNKLNKLKRAPLGQTQQIKRRGFRRAPPRPRMPQGMDEIIADNNEKYGKQIRLSDKTLRDLFEVAVPDPSDTKYAAEGRLQRTKNKIVNFGQATKNLNDQMATINAALTQSRTESLADKAKLMIQINDIAGDTSKLRALTDAQWGSLGKVVDRLNIPTNWRDAGFQQRLWSFDEVHKGTDSGRIITFLMANSPWG